MPQFHVDYPVVVSLETSEAAHVLAYLKLAVDTRLDNVDWLYGIIDQLQSHEDVADMAAYKLDQLQREARKKHQMVVYEHAKRAVYTAVTQIDSENNQLPF